MTQIQRSTARRLRTAQTDAEHRLWEILRGRRLAAAKFRRQHPVGRFIVDFYCASARLAVELDGAQHHEIDAVAYDSERTKLLEARAIRVLRFTNDEVVHDPERVANAILEAMRP
jgi:very-short-patch-repair endonuclease